MNLPTRIRSKFVVAPSGCWLWTAAKIPGGYGAIGAWNGRSQVGAHRAVYELLVGPIPEGMQIDHLCKVRNCVNPSHMEVVTLVENVMRGNSPAARNARKTHCPSGHEYAGDNLYIGPRHGDRHCRACRAAISQRRRARAGV